MVQYHRSTTVFIGLGPMRLFLFPKLKLPLRGIRFDSIEAVKENSQMKLKASPNSAYKACFDGMEIDVPYVNRFRRSIFVSFTISGNFLVLIIIYNRI